MVGDGALLLVDFVNAVVGNESLEGRLYLCLSTPELFVRGKIRAVRTHNLHGHVPAGIIHDYTDGIFAHRIGSLAIRVLEIKRDEFPGAYKLVLFRRLSPSA